MIDISFGCSMGFRAKSCLKFHSLDCVRHSQGIGFGIITIEFFSFACQIKVWSFGEDKRQFGLTTKVITLQYTLYTISMFLDLGSMS